MTKKEILKKLTELKNTVVEFNTIKYESTERKKILHEKISELYGMVQKHYLIETGEKNIEVPVAGSQLISKFNNYFEAGYLSGRTIHSHQGYMELLSVIGKISSEKNINSTSRKNNIFTKNEIIGFTTILFGLIGGSFLFGKYYGENRFDQIKIDLSDENKLLKQDTTVLKKLLINANDSIVKLNEEYKLFKTHDSEMN
jgi:hypothetical protein